MAPRHFYGTTRDSENPRCQPRARPPGMPPACPPIRSLLVPGKGNLVLKKIAHRGELTPCVTFKDEEGRTSKKFLFTQTVEARCEDILSAFSDIRAEDLTAEFISGLSSGTRRVLPHSCLLEPIAACWRVGCLLFSHRARSVLSINAQTRGQPLFLLREALPLREVSDPFQLVGHGHDPAAKTRPYARLCAAHALHRRRAPQFKLMRTLNTPRPIAHRHLGGSR